MSFIVPEPKPFSIVFKLTLDPYLIRSGRL